MKQRGILQYSLSICGCIPVYFSNRVSLFIFCYELFGAMVELLFYPDNLGALHWFPKLNSPKLANELQLPHFFCRWFTQSIERNATATAHNTRFNALLVWSTSTLETIVRTRISLVFLRHKYVFSKIYMLLKTFKSHNQGRTPLRWIRTVDDSFRKQTLHSDLSTFMVHELNHIGTSLIQEAMIWDIWNTLDEMF